jgi:hypothetical protein
MSSVTSCVGGGLFICFTCLHVPYSTVTLITCHCNMWQCVQRIDRVTDGLSNNNTTYFLLQPAGSCAVQAGRV